MAETPDQVLGFFNDLWAVKAKPQGEREVEELRLHLLRKSLVSLS
ncbi:hypothetical protein O9993_04780 [Vibrio lentus]|nr:hypothetical protein [Vibrio lentus]